MPARPLYMPSLVALITAALCVASAGANASIAGDVDASGAVDATDVQLVINAALGKSVSANSDIGYDPGRSTTAIDVQLVINAANGVPIDTTGIGVADFAEANLRSQLQDAMDHFTSADLSPAEAADNLYTAFQSLSDTVGHERAQSVLRDVQKNYVNAGGSLSDMAAKSSQIPPLAFTPAAVAKRRADRAIARALNTEPQYVLQPLDYADDSPEKDGAYRNTVIYVNGIWTQFADFVGDAEAVKAAIADLLGPYAIKFSPIWNPTAGFYDLVPQCVNQKLQEWIEQSINLPDFNPTSLWIRAVVSSEVNHGHNVVMLPHSQGNFHVRQALNELPTTIRASVNVIELASPVKNMPSGLRNLTRVDIRGDLIPELSGATLNPLPYEGVWGIGDWLHALLPSPYFDPLGIVLLDHHDLKGAYLQGQSKATIIADVAKFCETP